MEMVEILQLEDLF